MRKIVISDTSCLIVLDKINKLFLLKDLYTEVITTPEIASEFGSPLPEWILILSATNRPLQNILEQKIDLGEASAIALSTEFKRCSIILDDLRARKIAHELRLDYTGTLGIIVKAKKQGLITFIKPVIDELKTAGLRFSEEVEKDILLQANEL